MEIQSLHYTSLISFLFPLQHFKKDYFILFVYFAHMYVCVLCAHLVLLKVRRGCQIP